LRDFKKLGFVQTDRYTAKNKAIDAVYFLFQLRTLSRLSFGAGPKKLNRNENLFLGNGESTLAKLFNYYGSDKSSHHDYHVIYEGIFGDRRFEINKIVEIGIGSVDLATPQNMGADGHPGGSLRAFRDWAPRAEIMGADIDEKTLFQEERINTCIVNQLERQSFKFLKSTLTSGADLIVIDGLHTPRADMNSLLELLPCLSPSGCFVIEDISPRAARVLWPIAKLALRDNFCTSLHKMKNGYVFVITGS
jgi:hypothetical protein